MVIQFSVLTCLLAGRVPGFWFLVSGSWFLVPGFWFLVPGFWFLVSCSLEIMRCLSTDLLINI